METFSERVPGPNGPLSGILLLCSVFEPALRSNWPCIPLNLVGLGGRGVVRKFAVSQGTFFRVTV